MNDSLVIGSVLIVLIAALAFYLLSRMSYLEKKMGLMEAVLIDIKMALESIEQEHDHVPPPPLPATSVTGPGAGGSSGSSASLEKKVEAPQAADEKFYSSVLDEVHEEAEEKVPETSALDEVSEAVGSVSQPEKMTVGPNYDAMTRGELVTLAEQRGLRVPKRLGRGEVITLLRKSDTSRNDESSTGTDNASGPGGSLFSSGGAGGGSFSVDLGQADSGAPLEEATL
jgi:hypothetical protein